MGICQVFLNNNGGLSQSTKGSVYKKLAYASLHIKDNQAALSWSKKALDIAPSPVEHYIAGEAYAALKNPSAAIEEFSAALVLAPKYTLAFHRRGEAYLEIDRSLGTSTREQNLGAPLREEDWTGPTG